MRKRSNTRFVNGLASALAAGFFAVHSLLGGLEGVASLASPAQWVIWIGVWVVIVHVLVSIATSYLQLADTEFPPSPRKKRHLALKWATGVAVAVAATAHIVCVRTFGPDAMQVNAISTVVALALLAAFAVHVWVGAKSLASDVGLGKGFTRALRAFVCVFALVVACVVVAGIVWW